MGDANGLKLGNNAFGHEEGDRLLKRAAEIFKSICGDKEILAHIGGVGLRSSFRVLIQKTWKINT
jgi:GGDEF domain-containing protein